MQRGLGPKPSEISAAGRVEKRFSVSSQVSWPQPVDVMMCLTRETKVKVCVCVTGRSQIFFLLSLFDAVTGVFNVRRQSDQNYSSHYSISGGQGSSI